MAIDKCGSSFAELAATVLPKLMDGMHLAMKKPKPLAEFCRKGEGVKTIVKQLRKQTDFSGCYVLLEHAKPFYVGISRSVVARLRQHGRGKTHYDASLAYSMARAKVPHKKTRAIAMKDPEFLKAFTDAQRLLISSGVAFVEIENPLELYLFEAYCAMKLNTCEWNTFRTH